MKKKILLSLLFLILGFLLVFLINVKNINAEGGCGLTTWSNACIADSACGYTKCFDDYETCDKSASGICKGCESACELEGCQSTCYSNYASKVSTCQTSALNLQDKIMKSGDFSVSIIPDCREMNSCMQESIKSGILKTPEEVKRCATDINKDTYIELLKKHGPLVEDYLDYNVAAVQQAIEESGYQFTSAKNYIKLANAMNNNPALSNIANNQRWCLLSEPAVRAVNSRFGVQLSFVNQAGVVYNVLKSNPLVQFASFAYSGYKLIDGFIAEDPPQQVAYAANNQAAAQQAINTAQNAQPVGTSQWTNCPGHRDGRCNGNAVCVTDSNSGSSQCIAALPGQHVTVAFGSILVIDTKQNFMFTLTGKENEGVVYQNDGFVNIDKGGTTKIDVAGQGAFITDVNYNQLYLLGGTTTYFGNGNDDTDVYLTNTFMIDLNSGIAVDAVNEIDQSRLNVQRTDLKQNNELAFTINKLNLKPYKNSIDISGYQNDYQIFTRGFSNILLIERDKIFPLMTRNLAKGDSLIVKNKDVQVPFTYLVDDENYKYEIKTIDDSTKVITENGKIIQDSSSFDYALTKRQAILVYSKAI